MKGIIMAGGEGTRLRPLTCDCPKPMLRLMGQPLMAHAVRLLARHGIHDIGVTLGYMPEAIQSFFGDGGDFDARLHYYIERMPLGTAGGVKQASALLGETFVVLSGDGLTDLDIAKAAAFHRAKGALATLVLKHADDPLDYGVVDTDPDGRVRSFQEKPDWAEVLTDTVNTGIYLLEPEVLAHIPEGRPCDFGHELFPRLVKAGLPVYGYVTDDYWCDVGDVGAYLAAHADCMEGRVRLPGLESFRGKAILRPGAAVDRAAVLEGPCLIEAGARVRAGAYVGPYSVVGANCEIGEGASVKRGVLWPGARLMAHAQARGCVLGAGAALSEGAQAYEESVLGTGAAVEARGVLLSGAKLWPGKRVDPGERLDANRVWGCGERGFHAGALPVDSPADAARAAQAVTAALKPREVALGRDDAPLSLALWHAAAAGIMAQDARVIDAGRCTLPLLRHIRRRMGADVAMLVGADGLIPLNEAGGVLSNPQRRAVTQFNARQDYPRPALDRPLPALDAGCADAAYVADAAALFEVNPAGAPPAVLFSENKRVLELARRALDRAGLNYRVVARETDLMPVRGEIGLLLDATGERCAFSDEHGGLTEAQQQLMTAWTALERGAECLPLSDDATRGIEALAERYHVLTERTGQTREQWADVLSREHPFLYELYTDGLSLALSALSLLTEKGMTLADWRRAMPEVHRRSRAVPIPNREGGRLLHAFAQTQRDARLGGGVRVQDGDGWAWVGAADGPARLRVIAEAATAETADALCDMCVEKLVKLAELN